MSSSSELLGTSHWKSKYRYQATWLPNGPTESQMRKRLARTKG
ncbi:hypothetical protein PENANT_c007G04538 [Penicillium antarcticum]|uniref:Uncharacterized protein n=1 Tax=Penicillium antarcticum TaxID=416450 RepID=A0A1V6QCA3_9EURO|nr:hypothetical protein PENANT_c007G04538 [Penicillium antarcticum]